MPSVKSGFQICVMFLLRRRRCRLTYPIIALLLADVFPMPLAYPRSRLHPHSHSHSRFHIGVAGISKIFLLALAPYILYPISYILVPISCVLQNHLPFPCLVIRTFHAYFFAEVSNQGYFLHAGIGLFQKFVIIQHLVYLPAV